MSNAITKNTIRKIEGYVMECIGNDAYELEHMRRVVEHALDLAEKRGLDPSLAEASALLHDIGRWSSDSQHKAYGHGKMGAKIVKKKSDELDLPDDSIKAVARAVRNHTKKTAFHENLSELIKDADALAHDEEGIDLSDKPMEIFRINSLKGPQFRFCLKRDTDFDAIIMTQRQRIHQLLSNVMEEGCLNQERIHEMRIQIRTYRSILEWMGMDGGELKSLKQIFKGLEKARSHKVLIEGMIKAGASESAIVKLRKKEMDLLDVAYVGLLDVAAELEAVGPDMYELESYQELLEDTDEKLKREEEANLRYVEGLQAVDTKKPESLHRFRILGKRYRGMLSSGIIEMAAEIDIEILERIHDILGKLQDISASRKLLYEHKKTYSKKDIREFEAWCDERHDKLMESAELEITKLRIRINHTCSQP